MILSELEASIQERLDKIEYEKYLIRADLDQMTARWKSATDVDTKIQNLQKSENFLTEAQGPIT